MNKIKMPRSQRECQQIPHVLLPYWPLDPKIGSPAWMTPTPRIRMLKRGDAMLLDDVVFRDRRGRYRRTPRGLPCDFMSYPWVVRALTGWDKYDPATLRTGATHDCPYLCHDHLCNWPLTRKEVDIDLLDCLRCESPGMALVKYRGVRRWGWITYGQINYDPLFVQWIDALWEGDDALDEWIDMTLRREAA